MYHNEHAMDAYGGSEVEKGSRAGWPGGIYIAKGIETCWKLQWEDVIETRVWKG